MKDKDFYGGSGKHPIGGSEMIYLDGKWYDRHSIDYLKSQSPKSLNRIKNDTVNHTGFSKSRIINDDEKSEREQQLDRLAKREGLLDRLTLMKTNRARLLKQLAQIESVIKSIETDLSI